MSLLTFTLAYVVVPAIVGLFFLYLGSVGGAFQRRD